MNKGLDSYVYLEKNETCLSNTFLLLKTYKVIIFLGVASSEYVTILGLLNAGQRIKKSYLIVKKKNYTISIQFQGVLVQIF